MLSLPKGLEQSTNYTGELTDAEFGDIQHFPRL